MSLLFMTIGGVLIASVEDELLKGVRIHRVKDNSTDPDLNLALPVDYISIIVHHGDTWVAQYTLS